jgi:signal transduction histidine kinase
LALAGKVGALYDAVTAPSNTSLSSHPSERSPQEAAAFAELRNRVAVLLLHQLPEIVVRWEQQARGVALREGGQTEDDAGESGVAGLIQALAQTLASDGATSEDSVALGLTYGADAFEEGASLHHMLKGLDLLGAMTLYAVETAVSTEIAAMGGVADGVRLSRRLQQAMSLLALASTKGYTQAVNDRLRDQFRHLRHDLRNPLGTIKSVLALMDDESMPVDARTHPRFRAMAARNAGALDELIGARLSDASVLLPSLTHQNVSLRTIACGVRRDLRAEWEARDATVSIAAAQVRVRVDAVSLELLLHSILLAALQESKEGDELVIEFLHTGADRTALIIDCEPGRPPIADVETRERLAALAARMGARLEIRDQVVLSIATRPSESMNAAAGGETEVEAPIIPRMDA